MLRLSNNEDRRRGVREGKRDVDGAHGRRRVLRLLRVPARDDRLKGGIRVKNALVVRKVGERNEDLPLHVREVQRRNRGRRRRRGAKETFLRGRKGRAAKNSVLTSGVKQLKC